MTLTRAFQRGVSSEDVQLLAWTRQWVFVALRCGGGSRDPLRLNNVAVAGLLTFLQVWQSGQITRWLEDCCNLSTLSCNVETLGSTSGLVCLVAQYRYMVSDMLIVYPGQIYTLLH